MKSLKCLCGFHSWKTTSQALCKANLGNMITGRVEKVPAMAKIQVCERCKTYRGILTDGCTTTVMDPDFLISDSQGLLSR